MGLPGEIKAWDCEMPAMAHAGLGFRRRWHSGDKSRCLLGNVSEKRGHTSSPHTRTPCARVCGPTVRGHVRFTTRFPGRHCAHRVSACSQLSPRTTFKMMPGTEPQLRTRRRRPRVACLCRAGASPARALSLFSPRPDWRFYNQRAPSSQHKGLRQLHAKVQQVTSPYEQHDLKSFLFKTSTSYRPAHRDGSQRLGWPGLGFGTLPGGGCGVHSRPAVPGG